LLASPPKRSEADRKGSRQRFPAEQEHKTKISFFLLKEKNGRTKLLKCLRKFLFVFFVAGGSLFFFKSV